jgi:hypothetical protein
VVAESVKVSANSTEPIHTTISAKKEDIMPDVNIQANAKTSTASTPRRQSERIAKRKGNGEQNNPKGLKKLRGKSKIKQYLTEPVS